MRLTTWLLVAALAAIGLAATLDALLAHDGSADTARPATTQDERARLASQLRDEGISGALVVTDRSCRVRRLRLPSLDVVEAASVFRCRPDHGTLAAARCKEHVLVITTPRRRPLYDLGACAAQADEWWRRVYLSTTDLRKAFRFGGRGFPTDPRFVRSYRVTRVAWMKETRFAVVLRVDLHGVVAEILAVYERRRPLGGRTRWTTSEDRILRLEASARGNYLLAVEGDALVLLDDRARVIRYPLVDLPTVHAIAWSPDERWAAAATRASVYLFAIDSSSPRIIRLPLVAADVSWSAS